MLGQRLAEKQVAKNLVAVLGHLELLTFAAVVFK